MTRPTASHPSPSVSIWRILLTRTTFVAVAGVLATELLLRVPVVRAVLPQAVPHYSYGVEKRLRALDRMRAEEGDVDLLVVGSSVVWANLRPLVLDRHLSRRDAPVRVFNGGLSGLVPDQVRLYLEHLLLDRAKPRVVLQGVRFPELASGRAADDFERLARARVERLWLEDDWWSRMRAAAVEHSALLYYRGALTDFWSRVRWPPGRLRGFDIDRRGWSPSRGSLTAFREQGRTMAAREESWPAAEVAAGLDALARTAALCRDRGIDYLVLDVPEHGEQWSTPAGRALHRRYLDALRAFGVAHEVPVLILGEGDPRAWQQDRWFADGHHMSRDGAQRFSRQVAAALEARAAPRCSP